MNVRELYTRAEITIWEVVIAIMLQSRIVQKTLIKTHMLIYRQPWILRLPKPVYWAGAGIGVG
ncbi:MAG: hypothetical protein R3335_15090, partial [Anaerolineales bacterium]|nr:hypothetical protein [Anaerolineales bacterium]